MGITAMTQSCCQPVLGSCAEPEGNCSALNKAAVPLALRSASLYEKPICIGLSAVTQGCCQPDLHSSTELEGKCSPLNRAAVPGTLNLAGLLSAYFAQQH